MQFQFHKFVLMCIYISSGNSLENERAIKLPGKCILFSVVSLVGLSNILLAYPVCKSQPLKVIYIYIYHACMLKYQNCFNGETICSSVFTSWTANGNWRSATHLTQVFKIRLLCDTQSGVQ